MNNYRESLFLSGIALLFILLFFGVFSAFQNEKIYNNTLGKISFNEHRINGEIKYISEPFLPITNSNLRHWDVIPYEHIKNNGYSKDFYPLYAFYPLFPFIWHISQLDIRQVCLLNYVFYILGIIVLFNCFGKIFSLKEKSVFFVFLISLPSTVVFIMPYSEAVFFLTLSIAIWGYVNKKIWILFVFLILASMTRRASILLLAGSVISCLLLYIRHRNLRLFLVNLFQLSFPLVIGTSIVSIIQYLQGSGSFFTFIQVTGIYAPNMSFPTVLKDWSHNSYPLNMAVLFTFLPLVFFSMIIFFVRSLGKSENSSKEAEYKLDTIALMGGGYFAAAIAFILFFQGGSLNSTFRGIVCTPFFVVLLFYLKRQFTNAAIINILLIMLALVDSFFFLKGSFLSDPMRFSYLSQIHFIAFLFLWFNLNKIISFRFLTISLFIWLIFSVTLIGIFYDSFLGNGWIFT